MQRRLPSVSVPLLTIMVVGVTLFANGFIGWWNLVSAAQLENRSLQLSDSVASAPNVNYVFRFTIATAGTIGSIVLELCSNDPFPETPCTAPPGLDMSGATLTSQTGETGFSIDASTTANRLVLTRAPAAASTTAVSYTLQGVTNPSAAGSYYGRFLTYATNDASGALTDKAGIAWTTTNGFSLSTEVPQFLEFCTGITISAFDCNTAVGLSANYGVLSSTASNAVTSQMVAVSNAGFGYSVGVYGLTMTSGTNIIPALTTPTFAAPGNSQFGINLRSNSIPSVGEEPTGPGIAAVTANYALPDRYLFQDGDIVVSSPGSSDYRKFTTTYLTNVSTTQPAGRYGTTLTYICLGNF